MNDLNKYNMLKAAPANTIRLTRIRKENSSPISSTSMNYPSHILNLNLNPSSSPPTHTLDPVFKSFYNGTSRSWRLSHLRGQQHLSSKDSREMNRDSIVGTPFAMGIIIDKNKSPQIPILDGQHYQNLIKTIIGIRRGRILSELRYSQTLNPQFYQERTKKLAHRHHTKNQSLLHPGKDISNSFDAPRVVNISAQLLSRHKDRQGQKNNSFQKVFKNKLKLQSKYIEGRRDVGGEQVGLLGDEELTIHQMGWTQRSLHRPFHS